MHVKLQSEGVINHFCFLKETKTLAHAYTKGIHTKNISCLPLSLPFFSNIEFKDLFPAFGREEACGRYLSDPNNIIFVLQDNYGNFLSLIQCKLYENTLKYKCLLAEKNNNEKVNIYTENGKSVIAQYFENNFPISCSQNSKLTASNKILTSGPSITATERFYAFDAICNGWNNSCYDYIEKFESKFQKYLGVNHCLTTSSCTGALQIGLMALGIGEGDEVIVPDLTWVATASAVLNTGATPIFSDVEPDTYNLNPEEITKHISRRTKAIIAVHMYGHPARMDSIRRIAQEHGLRLIEDAAPAIGAKWQERLCGTFGDFSAFSFQGAKLLVTGEGGMFCTNNTELFLKAKQIADHGRSKNKGFWIDRVGVKFKMSNMQAALGLAQLERIDTLIHLKKRVFQWYYEELKDLKNISLNREIKDAHSIYWMTSIILKDNFPLKRDDFISELLSYNIDSRPFFPSISQYKIWDKKHKPCKVASYLGGRGVNLPSGVKVPT